MFILRFIRNVVDGVMNTINQQFRMIGDAITSPLRGMISQVLGGVWKGDGANRFVAEMTNEVIPMLVNIANVGFSYNNLLRKAMDAMNNADRKATSEAQKLFDIFGGIFR